MKTGLKVFAGMLAGAGVGLLAGVLMAPDKGIKTRRKIRKELADFEKEIEKAANKKVGEVKKEFSTKANEYKEEGKKILKKVPEVLDKLS